jgi:hypothetical protein
MSLDKEKLKLCDTFKHLLTFFLKLLTKLYV